MSGIGLLAAAVAAAESSWVPDAGHTALQVLGLL
jgi:hypothetical protein